MKFEELEVLVQLWATDKGIFLKSDPFLQFKKTMEEIEELAVEMHLLESGDQGADIHRLKSELGDVIVTLILMSSFLEIDIPSCLEVAYNKISKRKGSMVDGLFVKE